VRLRGVGGEGVPCRVRLGLAGSHPALLADVTGADRGGRRDVGA
jgi:hypothetical protein